MPEVQEQLQEPAIRKREKYRQRFFRVWGYIGIGIIVVAIAWCLSHVWDAVVVLLGGGIIAFIYAPIVNWLHSRFKVPRLLATFIGLLALLAVFALLVGSIIPPIANESAAFLQAIPRLVVPAQDLWENLNEYLGSDPDGALPRLASAVIANVVSQAQQLGGELASHAASGIFSGVTSALNVVVDAVLALILSFWFAKDFPSMEREISNVVGPRRGEDYRIVTTVFGRSLAGYLKGIIINSACTGLIAGVGFWLLGLPYSLLLGVMTAFLNIIPVIGPWIGGIIAFFVGLTVGFVPAVVSIVITVAAQQFTDNFISPKVMQTAVALHPVLVISALTAGAALGGIFGMILAVPLTAAIKGTFIYYFEKKTGRQLVSRMGMLFRGEPFCDEGGNVRPACDALGVDITGEEGVPPRIKAALMEEAARREAQAADSHAAESGESAGDAATVGDGALGETSSQDLEQK